MIEFAPTTKEHLIQLAYTMREADAAECLALGLSRSGAVFDSWKASHCGSTLLVDGQVLACVGLVLEPQSSILAPRRACVWLLTSRLVDGHHVAFHRAAKAWLRRASDVVDVIWNYVDARYAAALRWLRALGFVVHPATPQGPLELPFHLAVKEF